MSTLKGKIKTKSGNVLYPETSTDLIVGLTEVAKSGSYTDLTDKPTIPTVNDATLTITQNGTSKGTFTANSSTDTTIALSDTTYENKAASSGGTDVSLVTTGDKYTWNNKQNALSTQTAYSAKGSATKVPQITTNSLGQVTGITEVIISQPTVNDATLTITQNGTSKGTFTSNASSNVTIALTDTTYESKSAASGGTAESLVTTGEKYTWNNMLPLSGGTMSGAIKAPAYGNSVINDANNNPILDTALGTGEVGVGNPTHGLRLTTPDNTDILHQSGYNSPVNVLDGANTSANPTLSGSEPTLSSLKLNGTNYAIPTGPSIPTPTSADAGKVIGVDSNGQYALTTGGVTSFGGTTGAITLGSGLSMVGNQLTLSITSYDGTVIELGYSGNITYQSMNTGSLCQTYIKFGSAPTSASDYDSYTAVSGLDGASSTGISGDTTYSNETKVYVWGSNSAVTINGVTTNGGNSYSNAVEVTLIGNYDITLVCSGSNGGAGR